MSRIGVVAIGRNEGDRLRRCLTAVQKSAAPSVYVDSGSTDASLAIARESGCNVISLDANPFTAARARHVGFGELIRLHPDRNFVMFVDGDCEIAEGWLQSAAAFFDEHPDVAVVCGRRRERFPERSVYNQLCDIEWDTPCGPAASCGGDFMVRTDVYQQVGGFNESVVAGEEPELSHRIRKLGHQIWRMDAEMTLHDADIHSFRQWAQRSRRTGYGGCDVSRRFGVRMFDRILRSALFWAGLVPLATIIVASLCGWWWNGMAALVVVAVAGILWLLQILKISRVYAVRGVSGWRCLCCAAATMAGKFPTLAGMVACWRDRRRGALPALIEYK